MLRPAEDRQQSAALTPPERAQPGEAVLWQSDT